MKNLLEVHDKNVDDRNCLKKAKLKSKKALNLLPIKLGQVQKEMKNCAESHHFIEAETCKSTLADLESQIE